MATQADDYHEIYNLRAAYCHHLDSGEWAEWAELFAPDAVVEFDTWDAFEGRAEIREFGRTVVDDLFAFSMHTAQMPLIEIDGETGTGRWYTLVYYRPVEGDPGWVFGTYHDEYRVVDGEWKFDTVSNVVALDTGGVADQRGE
jgi:hypothetical protein